MNAQVQQLPATRATSVLVAMAERYGMSPAAFEQTLRATVVPKDCTKEQFAAFLLVAKQYDLNPVTKEIYAFPTRAGGIQPIVSVDGWCNLINSHPQCNGIEFDDHVQNDKVTAITCRIWRKDRDKPIVVTEYLAECNRPTDPWKQYPRRMLRHKALIQCARYAFGFAGIVDPDEAERMKVDVGVRSVNPPAMPPATPAITAQKSARDPETGEVWEDVTEATTSPPPVPPAEDPMEIPAQLRREPPPVTSSDDFPPDADWLKEIDSAFGGCEDFASLHDAQAKYMAPHKGKVVPDVWKRAEALVKDHLARINTNIMAAG